MKISINRSKTQFNPDSARVIARFRFSESKRDLQTIEYVLGMSEEDASFTLNQTLRDYSIRHRNISRIFEKNFRKISHLLSKINIEVDSISHKKQILIGSYFTMEYSIEAAALFNPSIIEHPDQTEIGAKEKRVIFSFRATGEGHISSIVFRTGIVNKNNELLLEPKGNLLEEAEHVRKKTYDKETFAKKLNDIENADGIIPSQLILDKLNDNFTYSELSKCIRTARKSLHLAADKETLFTQIMWLASSHYELDFSMDTNISERVIFPVSDNEKNGIEDARFVKFTDEHNKSNYYATYTAYDGKSIMPKLLETKDFSHFNVMPLNGEIAKNKGMALFPRKVNGKYAMLCRMDGCNNYISFSDSITIWREAKLLQKPKYPWELVQIGNCGSPIETDEGWIILTHGVGPMREYVISASLLDLQNPEKEIGRLKNPLLIPNTIEREGYVPNVVYSCGALIHNEDLIIPYAMSDYASTYATIDLRELLHELKKSQ